MHYEIRRGTAQQAIDYCRKEDTRIAGDHRREWGESVTQGKRTDVIAFRDSVANGSTLVEMLDEYPRELALYPKFYRLCKRLLFKHYDYA